MIQERNTMSEYDAVAQTDKEIKVIIDQRATLALLVQHLELLGLLATTPEFRELASIVSTLAQVVQRVLPAVTERERGLRHEYAEEVVANLKNRKREDAIPAALQAAVEENAE
jgi:hypothetical protein